MAKQERTYLLVEGGEAAEALEQVFAAQREWADAVEAMTREVGAEQAVNRGPSLVGFVFEDDDPGEAGGAKWRAAGELGGRPWFIPYRRSKREKDLCQQIAESRNTAREILNQTFLGQPMGWFGERDGRPVMSSAGAEKIGDKWIVSRPTLCDHEPPAGCRELKMSEYWRLKEESEAA